jgi:sugar phosphate permease
LDALRRKEVILLTLAYFFSVTGAYGFNLWLPTIIKSLSGLPNLIVTLVAALPYCAALVSMLLVGWSSDRTKERRWHTALSLIAVSIGLLFSVLLQNNLALTIAMFCLAGAGLYGYLPGFWSLPTSFLSGSAAAAAIGLINMIGNIGGFVGPYVVGRISTATNSFWGGILYLSASALISACLILALRPPKQKAATTAGT